MGGTPTYRPLGPGALGGGLRELVQGPERDPHGPVRVAGALQLASHHLHDEVPEQRCPRSREGEPWEPVERELRAPAGAVQRPDGSLELRGVGVEIVALASEN